MDLERQHDSFAGIIPDQVRPYVLRPKAVDFLHLPIVVVRGPKLGWM